MTASPDVDPRAPWQERAACAQEDPDLFFLPDDSGAGAVPVDERYVDQIAEAREVCARCPVTEACLADAMAMPPSRDRWAIAASTTPSQRLAMRRRISRGKA